MPTAGKAHCIPKADHAQVGMIRSLRVARRSAVADVVMDVDQSRRDVKAADIDDRMIGQLFSAGSDRQRAAFLTHTHVNLNKGRKRNPRPRDESNRQERTDAGD